MGQSPIQGDKDKNNSSWRVGDCSVRQALHRASLSRNP